MSGSKIAILWSVVFSLCLPIANALAENETCQEKLMIQQGLQNARDLQIADFIHAIPPEWSISERAKLRLRASFESLDFFPTRSKLVQLLVDQPDLLASVEATLINTRNSSVFLSDSVDSGKVKIEEIIAVYKDFSGVTTTVASFFGFAPVAVVTALHTVIKGTREHQIAGKLSTWFRATDSAHRLVTGQGVVARAFQQAIQTSRSWLPPEFQDVGDAFLEKSSRLVDFGLQGGRKALDFGRQITTDTSQEALGYIRNFAAELEVSVLLAKMTLKWRQAGIATTRVQWTDDKRPLFEVEELHHLMFLTRGSSAPYTLAITEGEEKPRTVLLTGDRGTGKTSVLQALSWAHSWARIGGILPARRIVFPRSFVITSLFSGSDLQPGESTTAAQMRELQQMIDFARGSDRPVFILVDNVASTLQEAERSPVVAQFRNQLVNSPVLVALSTNSTEVVKDLQHIVTSVQTTWNPQSVDGASVLQMDQTFSQANTPPSLPYFK
jgi:hypothetical protein